MTRRKAPAEGQPDAGLEIVPPADRLPEAAAEQPRRRRKRRPAAVAPIEIDAVRVADNALATVIGLAAHEVPGVVGMAPAGLTEGLRRILGVSQVDEGVEVEHAAAAEGEAPVTRVVLHVVVAYGVNIPAVAESVVERVRYAASAFAGVELTEVKVHVAGVSRG